MSWEMLFRHYILEKHYRLSTPVLVAKDAVAMGLWQGLPQATKKLSPRSTGMVILLFNAKKYLGVP